MSCTRWRAHRNSKPPRLISPRPTNSAGNISRSPKIPSRGSTYFGVATLPSRTTSQSPMCSQSSRASRSRGTRYRGSPASTLPAAISRNSSRVNALSGDTKPPAAVITTTPGIPGGGLAWVRAYVNLPRKYSPLMKLKISPSGTPSLRSRNANGERPFSPRINLARRPEAFAGESRKIRRRLDFNDGVPFGNVPAEELCD